MPDKRIVFKTEWFHIEEEYFPQVSALGGKPMYRIVEGDGVVMFALTLDRKIIMVRQFRPILNAYTLELPAGHVDEGEDNRTAASRELYEETGFICEAWTELSCGMFAMANRSTMRNVIFFGSNARPDKSFLHREDNEVKLVTTNELKGLILEGYCRQTSAPVALLLAYWRGLIDDL